MKCSENTLKKRPQGGVIMKINAITFNTSYYMPNKGSKLTYFKGDNQAASTLPAQGQDVAQFKEKAETVVSENSAQNSSAGSTTHKMFKSLKRFFTMDSNYMDEDLDDFVIYRTSLY